MGSFLGKGMEFTQDIIIGLDALSQQEVTTPAPGTRLAKAPNRNILVLLNYFGMSYVVSLVLTVHFTGIYITIPHSYFKPDEELTEAEASSMFYHRLLAWYMTFVILFNYCLTFYGAYKSVYCSTKDLPMYNDATHPDWVKCTKCDQNVPPRARHCNICQRCILKRDHHCYFTGTCIGFYNQRYFMGFCFHGLLGVLYALCFMEQYLSSTYVSFLGVEFFKYFLPYAFVVTLAGHTTWSIFFFIVLFYITFTTGIVCAYFFIWQANLMLNGQTSYEFVKGNKQYQTNLSDHLRSTFGPLYALNLIFPMFFLKNYGNGMDWKTHNTKFM